MKVLLLVVASSVTYLTIGTGWAFWRWRSYVQQELSFYERERQRFLMFHRVRGSDIPDYLKAEWRLHVESSQRLRAVPPRQEDHTTQLGLTLSLWPLSVSALAARFVYRHTIQRLIEQSMNTANQKIDQVRKDLK